MSSIEKLDQESFQNEVIEYEGPVLVDFTAAWCAPCKMLDPLVNELAQEWDGKLKVFKLDVDNNPEVAMDYQVMGIPTLVLFKNGLPVERVIGYKPKDQLIKKFDPHLSA